MGHAGYVSLYNTHTHTIYIYLYVCVCVYVHVCVCVCVLLLYLFHLRWRVDRFKYSFCMRSVYMKLVFLLERGWESVKPRYVPQQTYWQVTMTMRYSFYHVLVRSGILHLLPAYLCNFVSLCTSTSCLFVTMLLCIGIYSICRSNYGYIL